TAGRCPGQDGRLHRGGDCRPPGLCAAHGGTQAGPHPQPLGPGGALMNEQPPNTDLPLALAARIDAICDLFEKAWQAAAVGPAPPIEDYLKALPETERPLLLQEL